MLCWPGRPFVCITSKRPVYGLCIVMLIVMQTVTGMGAAQQGLSLNTASRVKVIIALLLGYMVAAVVTSDGGKRYVTSSDFDSAPSITFLWVKTFGFGFYAPAVLPFLIGRLLLLA